MTSPSRAYVGRGTFAVTVILLVIMFGSTTFAVWRLEKHQANNSRARDQQLCSIVAQVPMNPVISELERALNCKRFK